MVQVKIMNKPIIIFIRTSTIKRVILFDIILGTGIYYGITLISSSLIIATLGSFFGTEGAKKFLMPVNQRSIRVS